MAKKKDEVQELTPERMAELEERAGEMKAALAPYSDNLPYDRDRVVSELRFCMNQAAQGIVEAGKRLVLLKAHEGHGGFMKACEELGITRSSAGRFMRAAEKVAKLPTLGNLNRSKLYALLDVPDDELKEFEETGMLFGADRDEIDAWGVRELKDHIRKQRKQIEKGTAQLEDKDAKIKALEDKLRPKVFTDADEEAMAAMREAHREFGISMFSAMKASLKLKDASGLARMELVTLYTYMMKEAEAAMREVLDEFPDLDLEGVETEGLPMGRWSERIPGSDKTIEEAVSGRRGGRA